jgi:hypothetical protein
MDIKWLAALTIPQGFVAEECAIEQLTLFRFVKIGPESFFEGSVGILNTAVQFTN